MEPGSTFRIHVAHSSIVNAWHNKEFNQATQRKTRKRSRRPSRRANDPSVTQKQQASPGTARREEKRAGARARAGQLPLASPSTGQIGLWIYMRTLGPLYLCWFGALRVDTGAQEARTWWEPPGTQQALDTPSHRKRNDNNGEIGREKKKTRIPAQLPPPEKWRGKKNATGINKRKPLTGLVGRYWPVGIFIRHLAPLPDHKFNMWSNTSLIPINDEKRPRFKRLMKKRWPNRDDGRRGGEGGSTWNRRWRKKSLLFKLNIFLSPVQFIKEKRREREERKKMSPSSCHH